MPKWSSLFGLRLLHFWVWDFPDPPLNLFTVIRADGKQGQGSPPHTLFIATTFPACGNNLFYKFAHFPTAPGFGIHDLSTPQGVYSNWVPRMWKRPPPLLCTPRHVCTPSSVTTGATNPRCVIPDYNWSSVSFLYGLVFATLIIWDTTLANKALFLQNWVRANTGARNWE